MENNASKMLDEYLVKAEDALARKDIRAAENACRNILELIVNTLINRYGNDMLTYDLMDKINFLKGHGVIDEDLCSLCHKLRIKSNAGAHWEIQTNEAEAKTCYRLTKRLISIIDISNIDSSFEQRQKLARNKLKKDNSVFRTIMAMPIMKHVVIALFIFSIFFIGLAVENGRLF